MEPFEKMFVMIGVLGILLGVCFQNVCLTVGSGFALVAVMLYGGSEC